METMRLKSVETNPTAELKRIQRGRRRRSVAEATMGMANMAI